MVFKEKCIYGNNGNLFRQIRKEAGISVIDASKGLKLKDRQVLYNREKLGVTNINTIRQMLNFYGKHLKIIII